MSVGSSVVEVQLEIGHRATPKHKKTPDGHTHDWTVFIRGTDNSNIYHFVEKVIFNLHQSFPKPKRVIKEPPYQLQESGYASFEIPIEVYFRNKEEPKKLIFEYDLFLDLSRPISKLKREKLTFQNPSPDFRKKLLKGGGVSGKLKLSDDSNFSGSLGDSPSQANKAPSFCSSSSSTGPVSGSSAKASSVSTCKSNKSASESILPVGNGSNTSRREKSSNESSRSKHSSVIPALSQLTSGSSNASATPSNNGTSGSASRESSAKETKNTSSGTKIAVGNTTPVADSQFTDLFGPPIQTKPSASEATSVSRNSTTTSTDKGSSGSSGNTSAGSKKSSKNGAQSKPKGASKSSTKSSTTTSLFSGSKEALFSQHNELKSSSKASSGTGVNSTTASTTNSIRTVSQQQSQLSAKREHTTSKHSKVFSGSSTSQPNSNNPSRPSSGASFTKDSKESTKERLSFTGFNAKKENVSVKSTSKSSSSRAESASKKAPGPQDKKKFSKNGNFADCSVSSPVDVTTDKDDTVNKFKGKKNRDRSSSKSHSSKVKADDEENFNTSSKKQKSKDKSKKDQIPKKKKRKDLSSSESEDSEDSEDGEKHDPSTAMFAKSKAKRRRQHSGSSTSSVAAVDNDWLKASPSESAYLYHPQAAASMAKGAMVSDTSKQYSNKNAHTALFSTEKPKQKLLAEPMSDHFSTLLHTSKLSSSPSSLFSGAHHSPSLASPTPSGSPSPAQKMISSKTLHLHEDSNNPSRPSSGASFNKDTKEFTKERLSFSASNTKKENVLAKCTSKSSSSRAESASKKASALQDKKKSSKNGNFADCSVLSPVDVTMDKDDIIKKSKGKKDRDRSSSKVKVEDADSVIASNKKQKLKDKIKKDRISKKKKRKDPSSCDESDSEDSKRHDPSTARFTKSKAKRRRQHSGSSTSSVAVVGHDWLKASPSESAYLYHPQAAASMAKGKGAMVSDTSKLYSSKEALQKQKLLADSMGGHFPGLLHNPKLAQSPSSLFSDTSFSTGAHHSPSLASPALSGSPSPSQKMISPKASHHHEDSNGSSSGGLISKKESSSSSKKLSKISKDVLNNSSGTETSHLMSTKIKYRDDNSVTTIEIKSINKEKTWDNSNEIKKHKTTKESSKSSSSSSKLLGAGSTKQGPTSPNKGNKYKYLFKKRKSNSKKAATRDSDHSSESESSSQSSESDSSSGESDNEKDENEEKNDDTSRPAPQIACSPQTTPNGRLPPSNIYSRTNNHAPQHSPFERLYQNISSGYGTERHSSLSPPLSSNRASSVSVSEMRELQNRIVHLTDAELLQQVIDLVEERQTTTCFNIVNNCLQFDLLKLDQATLMEIKRLIC